MKTILLIDDERVLNESLSDVIEAMGHRINSCFSIDEARRTQDFSAVNIVLCDVGLPGESVFTFTQWIKNNHDHIVFVILSAFTDDEIIHRGMASGADHYLVKPTSLGALREVFDSKPIMKRSLLGEKALPGFV